jgi:UDP-N-acetylglucosamine--N-acetylmuramyl-(pentapeptide) pyrophosphoryl-undecaprenol N-acetylglucosamine transferase
VRILIAGGGSGGHIVPGLAVARAVRERAPGVDLAWLGARGSLEERLVPAAGIPLHRIDAGKLNRFLGKETVIDLLRVPVGFFQALAVVRRLRPDAVFTCGGFVAAPAGAAAWTLRRPLLALQQDVEPNLANRLIAPLADRIVVAFAASAARFPAGKAAALGNPLRPELLRGDAADGRRRFGLPADLPVVLLTGGGQGALTLNKLVLARLADWLADAAVIHLCGERSAPLAAEAAAALPASLRARYAWRAFVSEEMPDALAAADLVVSRAGAGTLAELAALGKAAILVPLPPPLGRSPQEANAALLARAGAAIVLREPDLTPDALYGQAQRLLSDGAARARLSARIAAFGRPRATEEVAALLLALARGGAG